MAGLFPLAPAMAQEAAASSSASAMAALSQSLLILLREGAEALLIMAALWVALRALNAPARAFSALLWGAVAGLAASVFAAAVIASFSARMNEMAELLEGMALLLAAGVLIFVSSWLLGQREAAEWKRRMQDQARRAMAGRSLAGLFAVGFLVVFREGAETVLFFYALIAAEGLQPAPLVTGAVLAVAILVTAFGLVYRLGIRLPLRTFFTFTAWGLFALAVIYAGKGVHELQEYGLLPETPLPALPRVASLGLYPYLETLLAQALTLAAGLVLNMRALTTTPGRQPAE
jgi:high-affinity iron transporter